VNTFTILRDLYPENERPRNLANLAYLLDTIQKHPGLRDVGYCVEIGISIGTFKDLIRELKYKGLVTQKGYEFIDPREQIVGIFGDFVYDPNKNYDPLARYES